MDGGLKPAACAVVIAGRACEVRFGGQWIFFLGEGGCGSVGRWGCDQARAAIDSLPRPPGPPRPAATHHVVVLLIVVLPRQLDLVALRERGRRCAPDPLAALCQQAPACEPIFCAFFAHTALHLAFGRKVLKPRMSSRWPLKSCLTRWITPDVSILHRAGGAPKSRLTATVVLPCPLPNQPQAPWCHPLHLPPDPLPRLCQRAAGPVPPTGGGTMPGSPCRPGLHRRQRAPPSRAASGRHAGAPAPARVQAAPGGLELLHDLQERVIHLLLVREAVLHLPQVAERVVGGELGGGWCRCTTPSLHPHVRGSLLRERPANGRPHHRAAKSTTENGPRATRWSSMVERARSRESALQGQRDGWAGSAAVCRPQHSKEEASAARTHLVGRFAAGGW